MAVAILEMNGEFQSPRSGKFVLDQRAPQQRAAAPAQRRFNPLDRGNLYQIKLDGENENA